MRDALLGHTHLDWDIATSARPQQVQRIFRRTIPVGLKYGTIGVLDGHRVLHEVTTFRRDVRTDGRHAEVEFGVSLDDDLARRDFTINAIAYSPTRNELRDPFGGRNDLRKRVVRAVGDPAERMREDRLRALRALRFAARFDFALDRATWRAIVESAPHLDRLSAERVKQEIEKTLQQVKKPSVAFRKWRESGAFATVLPILAGAQESRFAVTDALPMPGLRRHPARLVLRVASLFLGEPATDVREALRGLRFSNIDVDAVTRLVDGWHALGAQMEAALRAPEAVPDATIRRWVAALGRTQWSLAFRLAAAVWAAARTNGDPAPSSASVRSVYRRGVRIAFHDPVAIADLAVDGADLCEAGIPKGPAVGRTLARLLEAVVEDPALNQRDVLLALALKEVPA